MNVDWDWIKQRPHFIAEHLTKSNNVLIIYPYSWKRKNLSSNSPNGVHLYPFYRVPFGNKIRAFAKINEIILREICRILIKIYRPDIVWVSSPEFCNYLPGKFSAKLVYDCMDDVTSFPNTEFQKKNLAISESKLVEMSNIVICSSENIKKKLVDRVGNSKKYILVNNALEYLHGKDLVSSKSLKKLKKSFVIGYVGTISSWFDFDILIYLLNRINSIEFHLIGPVSSDALPVPTHNRLKYLGVVNHGDLQNSVRYFDAFIMPFLTTDLIQSVDPVKLYEYIFFDKPIMSINYPEIEKFYEFVDPYETADELVLIINQYVKNGFVKKYSAQSREQFISKNTWANRVDYIQKALESIL
jgi:hypothetical protein